MKVQIVDHQHKSARLKTALQSCGVEIVKDCPDVLLIDWDGQAGHYPETIGKAVGQGAKVLVYSHCAPVSFSWDGVWKPSEYVTAFLAQSPGEKQVMEAYSYPHPIHVIGWHYCDLRPFQPVNNIKSVLFAPWHPRASGFLESEIIEANRKAYKKLRQLPYSLTVRHLYDLVSCGLPYDKDVNYQQAHGNLEDAIKAIDEAEVIVSNLGTFATLAIARGKPVVMYGQGTRYCDMRAPGNVNYAQTWGNYKFLLGYFHDIADDFDGAFEFSAMTEDTYWRSKFIGSPLDADKLYRIVQDIAG